MAGWGGGGEECYHPIVLAETFTWTKVLQNSRDSRVAMCLIHFDCWQSVFLTKSSRDCDSEARRFRGVGRDMGTARTSHLTPYSAIPPFYVRDG